MNTEVEKYVANSGKIETADLDWEEAKRFGLSDDEVFTLTYFSDIESQTFRYMKNLLSMRIASDADVAAFLTTWNYEEYFHGFILSKILSVCGHPLSENRFNEVRSGSKFNELLEIVLGPIAARTFYKQFPAVYLCYGAIQEMTTLRGYERLAAMTANPVLKKMAERIAKQERRHFAWYFGNAADQLSKVKGARFVARNLLLFNWVPVGAGVKSPEEVKRLFNFLFPGEIGPHVCQEIDAKMGTLPGMQGIRLMTKYFETSAMGIPAYEMSDSEPVIERRMG